MVSVCISMRTSNIEHVFIRRFTICTFLEKYLSVLIFCPVFDLCFIIGFYVFFIYSEYSSFLRYFPDIFSQSVACLFIFKQYLPKSKNNLILERSSLLNFSFMVHGDCNPSEIICQI